MIRHISSIPPMRIRDVVFVTQAGGYNLCGEACSLMLLDDRGLGGGITAVQAGTMINAVGQYTSADDNARLITRLGGTPTRGAGLASPYAMLVQYSDLPDANKMISYRGAAGSFSHWIVRTSGVTYFDPLHFDGIGQPFTALNLDAININPGVNQYGVAETLGATMEYEAARKTNTYWRSTQPGGDANRQGWLDPGDTVNILRMANGRGQFDVEAVGTGVLCGGLWVDVVDLKPFVPPVVVVPPIVVVPPSGEPNKPAWLSPNLRARWLGVSCLNSHGDGAWALNNGCKSVLFLNGAVAAWQQAKAHPDALVWSRLWWQSRPSIEAAADSNSGADDPPNLIRTSGMNEGDYDGNDLNKGNPVGLRACFDYERRIVERMHQRGAKLCSIGHFSHGTPDITNPDIVKAWVETYGAYARDNADWCRVSFHLYTKGWRVPGQPCSDQKEHYDPRWFEGRDADFFDALKAGKPMRAVCDETGAEAGGGGMNGGYNYGTWPVSAFEDWARWWLSYRHDIAVKRDLWQDGACIFQFGDNSDWRGYDTRAFRESFVRLWADVSPIAALPA